MIRFWSLQGVTPYEAVRELQLAMVECRARDLIPDTLLFLEHEPVVTRGRGLQFTGAPRPRHMPLPGPLPPGLAFAESERGGDLTYHGPGQLVLYPIFRLDGRGFGGDRDIGSFLRRFEALVIEELSSVGGGGVLEAEARENATGVWVRRSRGNAPEAPGVVEPPRSRGESPMRGQEADPGDYRKIASMGIAVRKWVTYHGLAINCVNDMKPFHLISPCGFSPEVMVRLEDLLVPGSVEEDELKDWSPRGRAGLEARLARRFARAIGLGDGPVRSLSLAEAKAEIGRLAVEAGSEA